MASKRRKHPLLIKVKHGGRLSQWVINDLKKLDRPKDQLIEEAVIKQYKFKAPGVDKDE